MSTKTRLAVTLYMFAVSIAVAAAAAPAAAVAPAAARVAENGPSKIQMAILLDTSNSMDGLIDQARSQLWSIVNELARMRRSGKTPQLEVALFEYGNDAIPVGEGHIRMVSPLTQDLDKISESLFALKTNGGNEFCGQVVGSATGGLSWSTGKGDLKLVFIAGNEPFTQGAADFRKTCRAAADRGIFVSTIFCGGREEGVQTQWKEGADIGRGRYMNIDQNMKVPVITAPQDDEIVRLGRELNQTYVAYGAEGEKGRTRQVEQDANAASVNVEVQAQRSMAKASGAYQNESWDVVDAVDKKKVDLKTAKAEDLPTEMKKMAPAEREAYVKGLKAKRDAVQKRIRDLQAEREKYVAEEKKKQSRGGSLDSAVIAAVRDLAAAGGYK